MNGDSKYRNWAVGDLFYSERKHEEELAKLQALNTIASKSATSNTPVYIILGIGVVIMGVIIAVAMKKRKAA